MNLIILYATNMMYTALKRDSKVNFKTLVVFCLFLPCYLEKHCDMYFYFISSQNNHTNVKFQ